MTEANRRWVYSTVTASENKGIERIALTGDNAAFEVVGVDGSRRFGCRPVSGFQYAHTLKTLTDFTSDGAPASTKSSTVTDCFPVHFQIKEDEFGHGFVYRVKTGNDAAVYMDYHPTLPVDSNDDGSATSGWRTILISDHSVNDVDPDASMEVVSMNRYVFTFIKGRATRVFYITSDGELSPTYSDVVVNGGPGPAHTEGSASSNILSGDTEFDVVVQTTTSDAHEFEDGEYSFAFYLHNSLTGRRTALSKIVGLEETDFSSSNRRVTTFFDADCTKYDQIYLFRSVRLQSVGGTYSGAILHLDGIYNFENGYSGSGSSAYSGDYVSQTDDNTGDYAGETISCFKVSYQLDDIALAMQEIYLDRVIYDEEMPYSGSAAAFGGSLVVSDPKGPTGIVTEGPFENALSIATRDRNIGEVRWSSLTERSPELFPINNKYVPDVYQNRITRLVSANEFVAGFSNDRIYHIRRTGIFIQIEDLHAGFGLAGEDAVAAAGPLIYFVTSKGLKAVANNGQLDDVQALDNLLLEDWYDDLADLKLSYDPYASCLFILNPNKNQTVCMWFNTGRITEIHDAPFDDVKTGIWPQDWSNTGIGRTVEADTVMVERAFFLQNHPTTINANIPSGWQPRVYIFDFDRAKKSDGGTVVSDGTSTVRTLEFDGDVLFTADAVTTGSGITTVTFKAGTTGAATLSSGSGYDLVGAYAYIVGSSDQSKIGSKSQIFSVTPGTVGGSAEMVLNRWDALAQDDIIALSPVLFRYVGGALPMVRTIKGQVVTSMDLFQSKQLSSVGCHFADVSGGHDGYKFFKGLAYATGSDDPVATSFPLDFSGLLIGQSVEDGESLNYAAFRGTDANIQGSFGVQDSSINPGIEIFSPDLDFKLMAVVCRGRTTGTDTSERNTQ